MVSNLLDLQKFGYQLIQQLGQNHQGGRRTYLATDSDGHQVVIKQFLFATPNSDWSGYKYLEREIKILQGLNHPRIPKIKETFQTDSGLCLTIDYIPGAPISQSTYSPQQVHQIAIAILEILVYLQSQLPSIVHRDIKPDNIIQGTDGNFYLIDFGLSSLSQNIGASSVVSGTMGFIPPEQFYRQEVNKTSDLYSLGVTLYCLLNQISANELSQHLDSMFNIDLKKLRDNVDKHWLNWLASLIHTNSSQRPHNAEIALNTVRSLNIFKTKLHRKTKVFDSIAIDPQDVLTIVTYMLLLPPFLFISYIIIDDLNKFITKFSNLSYSERFSEAFSLLPGLVTISVLILMGLNFLNDDN